MPTCPLCLRERQLKLSHLLPKRSYARARDGSLSKPDPFIVSETGARRTSKQVRMSFLCGECEDLLNKNGESYALKVSFFRPGKFPLQDMLLAEKPIDGKPPTAIYAGVGISGLKLDKLVHYGAGIFWKAAAGRWPSPNPDPVHIDLGPYEEPLRKYVLGEESFPDTMALLLSVSPVAAPDMPLPLAAHPRTLRSSLGCHHHHTMVLGLDYRLLVGGKIPTPATDLCLVHSPERAIIMSEEQEMAARIAFDPKRVVRRKAWRHQPGKR